MVPPRPALTPKTLPPELSTIPETRRPERWLHPTNPALLYPSIPADGPGEFPNIIDNETLWANTGCQR
jgi:hypothetical protein